MGDKELEKSFGELPNNLEACHAVIKKLSQLFSDLSYEFKQLSLQYERLRDEHHQLKEVLRLNSNNSSLPPSRDQRRALKKARKKSERSSGGQKGHTGYYRQLVESEDVDEIVSCPLPHRCEC